MKKILLSSLFTITVAFSLAAYYIDSEASEAVSFAKQLTIQHYLDDMDYMLNILEDNFALFDVAKWARDLDIRAIVENTKSEIEDSPEMDLDGFYDVLTRNFRPLQGFAHFKILSPAQHFNYINRRNPYWLRSAYANAWARMREPNVMAFYEPRHPESASLEISDNPILSFFARLNEMGDEEAEFFTNHIAMVLASYWEMELADEMITMLSNGSFDEALRIYQNANEIPL